MPSIGSTRIDDSSASGRGIILHASSELNVGVNEVTIISSTVPSDKVWRIQYAEVALRGYGRWYLKINGTIIGGGLTNPIRDHDRVEFPSFLDAASLDLVEMIYLYSHGPNSMPIDAFIGILEI